MFFFNFTKIDCELPLYILFLSELKNHFLMVDLTDTFDVHFFWQPFLHGSLLL